MRFGGRHLLQRSHVRHSILGATFRIDPHADRTIGTSMSRFIFNCRATSPHFFECGRRTGAVTDRTRTGRIQLIVLSVQHLILEQRSERLLQIDHGHILFAVHVHLRNLAQMPHGIEGPIQGGVEQRSLLNVAECRIGGVRSGCVFGRQMQLRCAQMELEQFQFIAAPNGANAQAAGQTIGDGRSLFVVEQSDIVDEIVVAFFARGKGGDGVLGWK